MNLSAVVLAAGRSSRFGSPKALAIFEGEALIERWIKRLSELSLNMVAVCVNDDNQAAIEKLVAKSPVSMATKIGFVLQTNPDFPLFASLQLSLRTLMEQKMLGDGVLVSPVDVLAPEVETLRKLIADFQQTTGRLAIRPFDIVSEKSGHPVLLNKRLAEEILFADPLSTRLDTILGNIAQNVIEVPVEDGAVVTNINTMKQLPFPFAQRAPPHIG